MLARDDTNAGKRLTDRDPLEILLYEKRGRRPCPDQQTQTSGELGEQPETSVMDGHAAALDQHGLSVQAAYLPNDGDHEDQRDRADGQGEACPVAVVTAFLHRSRILRAGTMGEQIDQLVTGGHRRQDQNGQDRDLSESTRAHATTLLALTGLGPADWRIATSGLSHAPHRGLTLNPSSTYVVVPA